MAGTMITTTTMIITTIKTTTIDPSGRESLRGGLKTARRCNPPARRGWASCRRNNKRKQVMKTFILGLMLLGFICPVLAMDQTELDKRVRLLTEKFEVMQQKPDKRVPPDVLSKAKGIVLLDRTKAGFIFAYQGGGGVAMVRNERGQWSPVAFLSANEASLGFQVGGEQNFFVMLFMDTNSVQELITQTSEVGGDARGTAGNEAAGVGGKVASPKQYNVFVYSDRNGLYGGVSVKAGVISPDDKANMIYYGQSLTMKDILLDEKVKATQTANDLAKKIADYSRQ